MEDIAQPGNRIHRAQATRSDKYGFGMRIKATIFALGFLAQLVSIVSWSEPGMAADTSVLPQSKSEKLFVLPVEMDFDSGAANGNAIITRLIPVNSIPLNEDWQLVNIAMIVIADAPGGVPGSLTECHRVDGDRRLTTREW